MSAKGPFIPEKTFTKYNQAQGEAYANLRPEYHPKIYQMIIDHHTKTGGHLDLLVDIGCGPGIATHALAPKILPGNRPRSIRRHDSNSPHTQCRKVHYQGALPGLNRRNLRLRYPTPDPRFQRRPHHLGERSPLVQYPSLLGRCCPGPQARWHSRPVGPVWPCYPPSTPNASAIQAAMEKIQVEYLAPFYEAGNTLTRNRYIDLPLPWTLDEQIAAFDRKTFFRKEWGIGEEFFDREPVLSLDQMEKMMGVGSPVTRWREANPDAVGTEGDVVRICRRAVEKLLHEAGVEEGKEVIRGGSMGVLLMVKKVESPK
ncbi:hypothetical protein N7454_009192 [Penicillium verhagenii]|nr:hypothetical protein N7454_009192 [Penicillium verhagenii]